MRILLICSLFAVQLFLSGCRKQVDPSEDSILTPSTSGLVTLSQVFPVWDETVTLTFDLTKGNKELQNVTEDLYLYAGLITTTSANGRDWKHVVGDWLSNTAANKLQRLEANKYAITLNPSQYFSKASGADVKGMVFLIRNAGGTKVLRNEDGSDMYVALYQKGKLAVQFMKPSLRPTYAPQAEKGSFHKGESIEVELASNERAHIKLYGNGVLLAEGSDVQKLSYNLTLEVSGEYRLLAKVEARGQSNSVELPVFVHGQTMVEALPANVNPNGVTIDATTHSITFALTAPKKESVYLLGDFNGFKIDPNYAMKKTPDGNTFWLTVKGLDFSKDYLYQFLVDGHLKIADPYSDLVLDPDHDQYIANQLQHLPAYPTGKTTGILSVLNCDPADYVWNNASFVRPHPMDLVIYELLVRDFSVGHDYATVLDSIDYFKRLGVNAIQFLPLQESEGNSTWGYNPSYHLALDKYYGRPEELKSLIDKLHAEGIAVILDVVLNHAFGQSPMVQLYFEQGAPTATNPWFNRVAMHPFNVGFDFNHESSLTQTFVKDVLRYWLEEYRIDGFRFDLSKGFTQRNSGTAETQTGQWSAYDASRVALWKSYNQYIESLCADCYVILEHFADDQEERELANEGMLLWNNLNSKFNEATMGYNEGDMSDLNRLFKESRGFSNANFVSYMESHDEERIQFKNNQYGNQSGSYAVKDLATAMQRNQAAVAFLMASPGPKMIWQFGEFGYDVSIDHNGRTGEKPLRWNYLENTHRRALLDQYARMIGFKKHNTIFRNAPRTAYSLREGLKYFVLTEGGQQVLVMANFDVINRDFTIEAPLAGEWYDNISGGILQWNASDQLTVSPGAYYVLSRTKLNN